MNTDEKWDYLSSLEKHENIIDYNLLKSISNDINSEIRSYCAEVLALYPSKNSERILLGLLNDPDDLVRANACDSLYFSDNVRILEALKMKLDDRNFLVRGYATLSIAEVCLAISNPEIQGKTVSLLEDKLAQENDTWVKISILRSLILLGQKKYWPFFLETIHSDNYQYRNFALNLLQEMNIDENSNRIFQCLSSQLKTEKVENIKVKIQTLLNQIHSKNNMKG